MNRKADNKDSDAQNVSGRASLRGLQLTTDDERLSDGLIKDAGACVVKRRVYVMF